jgi:hypothetical protein
VCKPSGDLGFICCPFGSLGSRPPNGYQWTPQSHLGGATVSRGSTAPRPELPLKAGFMGRSCALDDNTPFPTIVRAAS